MANPVAIAKVLLLFGTIAYKLKYGHSPKIKTGPYGLGTGQRTQSTPTEGIVRTAISEFKYQTSDYVMSLISAQK